MHVKITPTRTESFFDGNRYIVSKTDLKGRITYVNRVFLDISQFTEDELLGAPHSIIRHPDMPRAVFKLLWDRLAEGHEVFAYVKNMTKRGDFYWVFAHVTPSYDNAGKMIGFHSNRRVPNRRVLNEIHHPSLCGAEADRGFPRQCEAGPDRFLQATRRNHRKQGELL